MGRKKKVNSLLFLEKNLTARNKVASRFRLQGYSVETAEGGMHAMHMVEKGDFNIIFVHGDQDDMSALEIICLMREFAPKNRLPILYMDKLEKQEDIVAAINQGASKFLVETDNFHLMLEAVKKITPI